MSRRVSGILPVDKGAGLTSFQVVAHLRRVMRAPKIGHGGTLDPDATGVLPILIGEATKLTPYLIELDKEYLATVRLGVVTDTQDLSGAVLETPPVPDLDAAAIEAVLPPFIGRIRQVPPMYSAVHHEGKRLYELAREGRTVAREAREVAVHAIVLESVAPPDFTIRVRCGKGTYVRTLAADIGTALGSGAALASLVRTRGGPDSLRESVSWADATADGAGPALWARMLPLDSALPSHPPVTLDPAQSRAFGHGQAVIGLTPQADGLVRVYGPDGALLGIGAARGPILQPERLLHADRPRPAGVSA
jgi:tRNA pseudouridine55 synthase